MTEEYVSFSTLRPVYLEVLKWLDAKDLAVFNMVSRDLRQVTENRFLWFHLYSCKYRTSSALPPPSFEDLLTGIATTELRLDDFDWKNLVLRRELHSGALLWPELQSNNQELQITQSTTTGRTDIVRVTPNPGIPLGPSSSCVIVERHVRELLLPMARPIAYVELFVKGGGSCGLVPQNWQAQAGWFLPPPFSRHVGWTNGSIGWHGDSGDVFFNSSIESHPFGPTFGYDPDLVQVNNASNAPTQPDVVGVGVEPDQQTVFFTKNGTLVGSVRILSDEEAFARHAYCYFSVCLHDVGDFVSINFGAARFVFDIEQYSQSPPPSPCLQL